MEQLLVDGLFLLGCCLLVGSHSPVLAFLRVPLGQRFLFGFKDNCFSCTLTALSKTFSKDEKTRGDSFLTFSGGGKAEVPEQIVF